MISLDFVVGGGLLLTFTYEVRGGPDHGRRVELAPVRRREFVESARRHFTDPAEFDRLYAPDRRPCIVRPDPDGRDGAAPLHPDTVAACNAILAQAGRGYNADGTVNEEEQARMCAEFEASRKNG